MSLQNTPAAYGGIAKFFHWIIFLLLLFMIIFGYFLEDIPKAYQSFTYNFHKLTGLTILSLMVLRGMWALMNPKPLLPFSVPVWQRFAERTVHYLFYFVIIAMPVVGWIGSVAGGRPPRLGEFKFNLPLEQNKELSEAAFNLHSVLAITIIVLFTIHVTAALYHHFIKRDNVLRRMMSYRT